MEQEQRFDLLDADGYQVAIIRGQHSSAGSGGVLVSTRHIIDDRAYKLETVAQLYEVTLIRVSWAHGIYGTTEEELITYVPEPGVVVWKDHLEEWDPDNPLHLALLSHLEDV